MDEIPIWLPPFPIVAGGKPSTGTKPDKRLKENKPKPVMPVKKGK